ncbi:MAG: hypothetical protein JJU33_00975 [Phycisphaerales bacterium]|nr:hypothetical protein [Phycisphaerales bacterium]
MNEQTLAWSLVAGGVVWCLWACWRVGGWRKKWLWRFGLTGCFVLLAAPMLMGVDDGNLNRSPGSLPIAGAIWLALIVPLALLGVLLVEGLRLAGWAAGTITGGRRRSELQEPDGSPRS